MARIQIDIGQLAVAMDSGDGSMSWFLDRETGDVIPLNEDGPLGEEKEIWEAIDAGSERYLEIPSRSSHEGFEIMEDFVASLDDGPARGALEAALRRPRPFRSFKDALMGFSEVRQRWFAYEEEESHAAAADWLRVEGIDAELVPSINRSQRGTPQG